MKRPSHVTLICYIEASDAAADIAVITLLPYAGDAKILSLIQYWLHYAATPHYAAAATLLLILMATRRYAVGVMIIDSY